MDSSQAGAGFGDHGRMISDLVRRQNGVRPARSVDHAVRLGVEALPEPQELGGAVAGEADGPNRVVLRVEDLAGGGELARLLEDVEEVFAVGEDPSLRVLEEELVLVEGLLSPLARAGEAGRGDELVVLHEAHEHAAQDPGHGHLGEQLVAPHLVGLAGAVGLLGVTVLLAELGVELGDLGGAFAQVVLELAQ